MEKTELNRTVSFHITNSMSEGNQHKDGTQSNIGSQMSPSKERLKNPRDNSLPKVKNPQQNDSLTMFKALLKTVGRI